MEQRGNTEQFRAGQQAVQMNISQEKARACLGLKTDISAVEPSGQ